MKLTTLTLAAAAVALLGPAAYAQQPQPAAPTPGSVTGDWNGAHAPSDDKQYKEKVTVPVGALPSASTTAQAAPAEPLPPAPTVSASSTIAPAATTAGADVAATTSFSNVTVTNGPVPDTAENRAKYGQPLSRAGKRTAARGN